MDTTVSRVDVAQLLSYRVEPQVLDTFPVGTFFLTAYHGENQRPATAMRLVKPRFPDRYPSINLSPGKHLLYYFWRSLTREDSQSEAVKKLGQASVGRTWRWIVQPGDPGFEELEAFKVACDIRRHKEVSPRLLYQALRLDNVIGKPNL